jgi:hypothetical protein
MTVNDLLKQCNDADKYNKEYVNTTTNYGDLELYININNCAYKITNWHVDLNKNKLILHPDILA